MVGPFSVDELDVNKLLEEWRWLCPDAVTLVARNGFGDLFLRSVEGKVLHLDVGNGSLTEAASSDASFQKEIENREQRDLWFAKQTLEAFATRGLKPNDQQCIGFKIPVVFRESANVPDNAYLADLYEHVGFLGVLHRQIAEVPNGVTVKLKVGRPTS